MSYLSKEMFDFILERYDGYLKGYSPKQNAVFVYDDRYNLKYTFIIDGGSMVSNFTLYEYGMRVCSFDRKLLDQELENRKIIKEAKEIKK